jgi:peptidoglycan/LPS O-acetylase OafA/YrhL
MGNEYLPNPINALRALAIICVFLLHVTLFESTELFQNGDWTFIFMTPAWAGVWILFIIAGYLGGKGFADERYKAGAEGGAPYIFRKFRNVWLPTIFFVFLITVLCYPAFFIDNNIFYQFFILTYNGNPGVDGIGATWFVFTIMWLFILTPFACAILNRIKSKRILLLVLSGTIIAGLTYRIFSLDAGLDWYSFVYTSPFGNIDLYFSGVLTSYILKDVSFKPGNYLKLISIFTVVVLIVINSWIYYKNQYEIYMYYLPTVYILAILLFLFSFKESKGRKKLTLKMMTKHPFSFIDWFAGISFEFYLFHSIVLYKIAPHLANWSSLTNHFVLVATSFVVSCTLAYAFSRIFKKTSENAFEVNENH